MSQRNLGSLSRFEKCSFSFQKSLKNNLNMGMCFIFNFCDYCLLLERMCCSWGMKNKWCQGLTDTGNILIRKKCGLFYKIK